MSVHSVSFKGTVLTISNGPARHIQMTAPIIAGLGEPSDKFVLVLVEPPAGAGPQPNLFCISVATGTIVWSRGADTSRSRDNIYTSMHVHEDGACLVVFDWDGYRSKLEISSGKVVECLFLK